MSINNLTMRQRFGSHSDSKFPSNYMYNRKDNKIQRDLGAVHPMLWSSQSCLDVVCCFALICRRVLPMW
jgi:hypothetical protein